MSSKVASRKRIQRRIRKKINGTASKPRLSVFRSNKQIYCQLVDDLNAKTLASASSKGANLTGNSVEVAKEVGKMIAKNAAAAGITDVVFDRGGYLYHGRVKSLAEGAREGGLKF